MLSGTLSGFEADTLAQLVMLLVWSESTETTMVTVAVAPTVRKTRSQVMPALQSPLLAVALMRVVPLGRASTILTLLAVAGPLLVTMRV